MLRVTSTHVRLWNLGSNNKDQENLEAAEMWFYSRILRIPWTAHQANVSVLQRMGQERKPLCCTEQRQLRFLDQVIPKGELEDLALSGRIPGKRARGAQRFTFIHNFKSLCKNPGNYGWLVVIEHNGKTS